MTIDLNCDMGEGMPHDAAIMPFISSANIACGAHAGDRYIMRTTIELCLKHSVAIGAHPGFSDKKNFGRTPIELSQPELYDLITNQLQNLSTICREMSATLHHVKPHGALYNLAARDQEMSKTIAQAVFDFNRKLIYYGLSGSYMISEAKKIGLPTAHEVFADRTYQKDGSLTPRTQEHALIEDENAAMKQVLMMIKDGKVEAIDKSVIPIQAETICIHGDGKFAVQSAQAIHQQLKKEGITIKSIPL
jgi:UPF0271 protein